MKCSVLHQPVGWFFFVFFFRFMLNLFLIIDSQDRELYLGTSDLALANAGAHINNFFQTRYDVIHLQTLQFYSRLNDLVV